MYLGFCLAGLAAGLWPEAIYPSRADVRSAVLPVLQALAVAQVAFVLLAGPILAARRCRTERGFEYGFRATATSAGCLLATLPFYVAAVWLSDATAVDAVRSAVYVACLFPLAWAAGLWLDGGVGRSLSLLVMLILAFGLPGAYYLAVEFLAPAGSAVWLWWLAPATFAWQTADSRAGLWWPEPLWAAAVWPAAALASILLKVVLKRG